MDVTSSAKKKKSGTLSLLQENLLMLFVGVAQEVHIIFATVILQLANHLFPFQYIYILKL